MPSSISHILIKYPGNKIREFKYFKDSIELNNIKSIVEPFCGSCAMSFHIWIEHREKFNYYLNDKDDTIFKHFEYLKKNNIIELIKKINIEKQQYSTKEKLLELHKNWLEDNDEFKKIILSKLSRFSFQSLTTGRCFHNTKQLWQSTTRPHKYMILFEEFLKSPNVFFTNNDWNDCYNKFKDDKEALILFDPPYVNSCNDFYKHRSLDIYDKLDDIYKNNARSYFIIQKNDKTDELFKEWNELVVYDKMYNMTQKKTQHIVYSN